jgi:hypothetical protein
LRAIRCANTYTNTNCHCHSDFNSYANRDSYPNSYAHAIHGKVHADAKAAPHPGTAAVVRNKS